jgi:osmotically inducible protein OsmC
VIYTAVATASGDGRSGHVRSSDGVIDEDLVVPEAMGGPGGEATNPEQLFAAGYAACFLSALKASKKAHGVPVEDAAVTADVGIGPLGDAFGLAVTLHVELGGGISQEDAEKAVAVAHQVCPYSRATRGNVEVTLDVEVA